MTWGIWSSWGYWSSPLPGEESELDPQWAPRGRRALFATREAAEAGIERRMNGPHVRTIVDSYEPREVAA